LRAACCWVRGVTSLLSRSALNPDLGNNNAAIVFGDNAPRGGRRASPNNNTLAFVFGNNSTALASPANPTVIGSGDNVSKP
jgi:hypothetical protein